MNRRVRKVIKNPDVLSIAELDPARDVFAISGVRIYDVGQGDAIAVLDEEKSPFLQIDYGGRNGHPFGASTDGAARRMPLDDVQLMMVTHWDYDHWCSAEKNEAARALHWLVPRQSTSPRAALYSAGLPRAYCIPEKKAGETLEFQTQNGDRILFEKIAPMPDPVLANEDCNFTGVALSIVHKMNETDHVILLPGDAPFDRVSHYGSLQSQGALLKGVIAFHHGSHNHWTLDTRAFLAGWPASNPPLDVVFSYQKGNSYRHPTSTNYRHFLSPRRHIRTPSLRANGKTHYDILF